MGVDYYSCENCGEIYNDCGDYYNCGECWTGFCNRCGEKELIEKYGVWDYESENAEDFNLDGELLGEEGCLKSCPICSGDRIEESELLTHILQKYNLNKELEWKELKGLS